MSSATLLFDVILTTATSIVFAYAGSLTTRRAPADPDDGRAVQMFGVWWYGLCVMTLLNASRTLLGLTGHLDPATHEVLFRLTLFPAVLILWGLVYYLAYIYSGNARLFWPIGIAHGALLVYLLYVTSLREPSHVEVSEWAVRMRYVEEFDATRMATLVAVLLVPVLAAAAAYATLFFKTTSSEARYRIAMVSGAFIVWFGSASVSAVTPLHDIEWWPVVSRLVSLGATLMIIAAYKPPRGLRDRAEEGGASAPGPTTRPPVRPPRTSPPTGAV